ACGRRAAGDDLRRGRPGRRRGGGRGRRPAAQASGRPGAGAGGHPQPAGRGPRRQPLEGGQGRGRGRHADHRRRPGRGPAAGGDRPHAVGQPGHRRGPRRRPRPDRLRPATTRKVTPGPRRSISGGFQPLRIPMSRILITSALPYINGVKHLGNLAGSMLPADVYARYCRLAGHEVLFICATDEHGTPAELAAAEAGQTVRDYCDEQHEIQKRVGQGFSLSFDWFGRSSNPPNHRLTQHFADVLEDNGLIDERTSRQVYSIDDKRFLPDRYVEGTCPNCGYEKARGDQCDNCGTLLDPVDLLNPYSSVSGSRNVEIRDTRHLFLLQTKMQDQVRKFVDQRAADWPHLTTSIAYK